MRDPHSPRRQSVRPYGIVLSLSAVLAFAAAGVRSSNLGGEAQSRLTTISIVGTTDLHGRVFPRDARGGLEVFGGFVANVRAARAADGGAVLLLDAGDTFQGGIESNLSEGALVVDAYNALGYTAAAIGNHEFEFGAVDSWDLEQPGPTDLRGALKARASQARFPFLAANLLDAGTGRPVEWPNVRPSTIVDAAGVKVGLVGVMTRGALSMTIAANVGGLAVAPLMTTVQAEASALRARGAQLIVLVAHAGGSCTSFGSPTDLASCDNSAEIFDVIRQLPRGLLNVVVAGHTHATVAHEVEGVAVVQASQWGRAFSRVDVTVDSTTGRVQGHRIFTPREVCTRENPTTHACAAPTASASVPVLYEGRPVASSPVVTAAMAPALEWVRNLRATPLGVVLESPLTGGPGADESPLGNAFADALRDLVPGTDAALTYGSGPGGLRNGLPAGPVTLGDLYDVFPFDNRVVRLTLTGAALRQMISAQAQRRFGRGRALGVSGMRLRIDCPNSQLTVDLTRTSGERIHDDETITLATIDFMARRGPFGVTPPASAVEIAGGSPLLRDAAWRWFRRHPGRLDTAQFSVPGAARWERTPAAAKCLALPR